MIATIRFMQLRTRSTVALAAVATALAVALPARALEPDGAGWYHTGAAVYRTKVAFVSFDVYRVEHTAKALPSPATKDAFVDLDAPKRFTITMLRDVPRKKLVEGIRDSFADEGYRDAAKIDAFVSAFQGDLVKGTVVTVDWDPAAKATKVRVSSGGSSTVTGADLMHATWGGYFHCKALGDGLIAQIR